MIYNQGVIACNKTADLAAFYVSSVKDLFSLFVIILHLFCTYLVVWKKPRCSCASSLFVVPERQSSLRSQTSPPQTKLGESWHRKALMPWRMTYEEFASGIPRRTSMAKPFLIGRPAHHENSNRLNLSDNKSNKAAASSRKTV
jgi:hypothetical protein